MRCVAFLHNQAVRRTFNINQTERRINHFEFGTNPRKVSAWKDLERAEGSFSLAAFRSGNGVKSSSKKNSIKKEQVQDNDLSSQAIERPTDKNNDGTIVDMNSTKGSNEVFLNSPDFDWITSGSIASFLLRKKEEEEAILGDTQNQELIPFQIQEEPDTQSKALSKSNESKLFKGKHRDPKKTVKVEIIDKTTLKQDTSDTDSKIDDVVETFSEKKTNINDIDFSSIDKVQIAELNESISYLDLTKESPVKDIKILPLTPSSTQTLPGINGATNIIKSDLKTDQVGEKLIGKYNKEEIIEEKLLPLSDPHHIDRIERDMRMLAISIASTVDTAEQWRIFCNDGGGVLPILKCIREAAREIEQGDFTYDPNDDNYETMLALTEETLSAACSACKTLRDLCAINKAFSSVLTDAILKADAAWSVSVPNKDKNGRECSSGGLISDFVTILRHANDADKLYAARRSARTKIRKLRSTGADTIYSNRRQWREAQKRCGLYVSQLLLAMAFASDTAINTLRSTDGLTDAVLASSSYATTERLQRRWVRYPLEVIKRALFQNKRNGLLNDQNPFLAVASVKGGLKGSIKGTSNKLLAALGYNVWVPKMPGQKGLRILCLDGGGTRGITAIASLKSMVDAIGGIEVCDSFDMITGTSTGAIIAFLVGLRRESSRLARKRYDKLIKRIFVKSALSTPMLVFTTASYDENPFNDVMSEILRDNSMLDSRYDPTVPLVFALSSKMSSTPTQICLFRNYNYSGGELKDAFILDPVEAREELGLPEEDDDITSIMKNEWNDEGGSKVGSCATRTREGSRHPGSFRVLQRAALRATTAAPTFFKPVLMSGELYCDGGIVASNPTAVAVHEARTLFPDIPIEMVVSCGTGAFLEEKSPPRIGWDGIIGQIVNSATDGEQIHHIMEDILGQGGTAQLGKSSISQTRYYRFNPIIGLPNEFPIDGTDPTKLSELSDITTRYMQETEQRRKLEEINEILNGTPQWKKQLSQLKVRIKKKLHKNHDEAEKATSL